MGYYTTYTITKVDGDLDNFVEAFNRHDEARLCGYEWVGVGEYSEPTKWYEHEQHIADAMVAAGTDGVDLHGSGEEHDDYWDKEFRLDRTHHGQPKVTVREFRFQLVRPETPAEKLISVINPIPGSR